jgi:hypothetical protein
MKPNKWHSVGIGPPFYVEAAKSMAGSVEIIT